MRKNTKLEKFFKLKEDIENVNTVICRLTNSRSEIPGSKPNITIKIYEKEFLLPFGESDEFLELLNQKMDSLKLEFIELYEQLNIQNEVDNYFDH